MVRARKKERKIKTVNLERQFLKYLLKDKIYLQRYHGLCKDEWFTTDERLFIWEKISDYYTNNRSILSKEQFEYELDKCFDEEDDEMKIKALKAEFDIIDKYALTEDAELLISKFGEVDLATDINDLIINAYDKLEAGKIDEAAAMLRVQSLDLNRQEHKGRILSLHEDTDDWVLEIQNRRFHPEKYAGIKTGFPTFDEKSGGLFKAELTVIFGLSGKGKSTVMKAMASNIRRQGYNVLHCGNEENEFQIRTKYQSLESGIPYRRLKLGQFSDEEFEEWKKFNAEQKLHAGGLYIYEFPQQTDATLIERAVAELKLKGIKIDAIFVDYLDLMAPTRNAFTENDEQGKITSDLKQLAINCDCPVVTATQALQQAEKQEMKERPFLTAGDVFGTKRKVHTANLLLGIVNQTATVGVGERTEEERKIHKLVLCVPKNRDGSVFTFRCKMHVVTGKVEEDHDIDVVGKALEKQALEMIDDTNPKGEIRSSIDLKQIEDEVSNELSKKVELMVEKSNAEVEEYDFLKEEPKKEEPKTTESRVGNILKRMGK